MNVFLVDDSPDACKALRVLLSTIPGLKIVGEADDVPAALDGVFKQRPDVVILDLDLATGHGFDVLKSAKKLRPVPLVIVLTNHTHPLYRNECIQYGADLFFDKTTDCKKMVDVLRQRAASTVAVCEHAA
jgi:two-component system, NarL family, response regulator DevR